MKIIDFNKKTNDLNRFEKIVLLVSCVLITCLVLMTACGIGYLLQSDAFTTLFG